MPELPEVETIRRQLDRAVKGATIREAEVFFGKRISPSVAVFKKEVAGRKIMAVERRAKLLRLRLSGGFNLFIHLKMIGRVLLKKAGAERSKHTHAILRLKDGRELHWEDVRKFGYLKLYDDKKAERFLADFEYGPEPLGRSFTEKTFADCLLRRPSAKIKPLLLEQKCIAGIGNIYATEALWSAKIHPLTRVEQLDNRKMKALHRAVVSVLKAAIPARGTSADSYVDLYGKTGTFVPKLKAYGREGEKCRRCGARMASMKIGGRGSAFCPKCQLR
jgi:formamidopyrimidine-DNA glycosylase